MQVKLHTLTFAPALGGIDPRPLEAFLAGKEVLALREHFFEVHGLPHLACLITYRVPRGRTEPMSRGHATGAEQPRAAPALSDDERALFETLRAWRAERARADGVPPYVIFTNRELAAVARARPSFAHALTAIRGIGSGKLARYGAGVLACLHGSIAPTAADREPDGATEQRQ